MKKNKKAVKKVETVEPHVILPVEFTRPKDEMLPDNDTCADCGKVDIAISIVKCPDCGTKVCEVCLAIHKEEHLEERYVEEEEEEERTNKPQWK